MSNLLTKSIISYKVGKSILDHGILSPNIGQSTRLDSYHSCVHCFYYACLQRMLHVIEVYIPAEEKILKDSVNRSKTHEIAFDNIFKALKKKCPGDANIFGTMFDKIKKKRIVADYTDQIITPLDATNVKSFVDEIIKILTNHYS
jgi:hypothetical protein